MSWECLQIVTHICHCVMTYSQVAQHIFFSKLPLYSQTLLTLTHTLECHGTMTSCFNSLPVSDTQSILPIPNKFTPHNTFTTVLLLQPQRASFDDNNAFQQSSYGRDLQLVGRCIYTRWRRQWPEDGGLGPDDTSAQDKQRIWNSWRSLLSPPALWRLFVWRQPKWCLVLICFFTLLSLNSRVSHLNYYLLLYREKIQL